jgi:hypothetical protein
MAQLTPDRIYPLIVTHDTTWVRCESPVKGQKCEKAVATDWYINDSLGLYLQFNELTIIYDTTWTKVSQNKNLRYWAITRIDTMVMLQYDPINRVYFRIIKDK